MEIMDDWASKVIIPKLPVRGRDCLNYSLVNLKTGVSQAFPSRACFSASLGRMSTDSWTVRPVLMPGIHSPMPADKFHRWIDLCKSNHIMPPDAEATNAGTSGSPEYHITLSGGHHQVFAGLNCYRWAVNLGVLPTLVVDVLDKRPSLHFFQALHFALKHYNHWTNHSFSDWISPTNDPGKTYLAHSLIVSYFFGSPSRYNKKPNPEGPPLMTGSAILDHSVTLGFETRDTYPRQVKSCRLVKTEHVLWDEWAPLYDMKDPRRHKVEAAYKEVVEARGYDKEIS